MTKYDIGQLQIGDRVKVGIRTGTVAHVAEPKWRDHKTKQYMHEVSGADIAFDDESGADTFIQIGAITLLESKTIMAAMPNKQVSRGAQPTPDSQHP